MFGKGFDVCYLKRINPLTLIAGARHYEITMLFPLILRRFGRTRHGEEIPFIIHTMTNDLLNQTTLDALGASRKRQKRIVS